MEILKNRYQWHVITEYPYYQVDDSQCQNRSSDWYQCVAGFHGVIEQCQRREDGKMQQIFFSEHQMDDVSGHEID